METYIIPTSSAEHIGANLLNLNVGANVLFLGKNKDGKNVFPDGETYVRIPDIELLEDARVIVLHSGMPEPDRGYMELQNVLDILNKPVKSEPLGDKKFKETDINKYGSLEVFFTYYAYGRQDKRFQTGEARTAESKMNLLTDHYGVQKIYTIDLHCADADWLKKYPVKNISADKALIAAIGNDGYRGVIHMAPDKGAQARNGIKGLEKSRENSYEVNMKANQDLGVRGKIVVVDDDIIGTGGTMVGARDTFLEHGAKDVLAAVTHGVMPEGIEKVSKAYTKLFLTNTINRPEANVDITELVWNAINNQEIGEPGGKSNN